MHARVVANGADALGVGRIRDVAGHGHPRHEPVWITRAQAEAPQSSLPFGDSDEHTCRGADREPVHHEMHEARDVAAHALPARNDKADFVKIDVEPAPPLRVQQPRKRQIHHAPAEARGHVLHQHPSFGRQRVQHMPKLLQGVELEARRQHVHRNPRLLRRRAIVRRRPDLHHVAGIRQCASEEKRVIAHAAGVWRILAGDDAPPLRSSGGCKRNLGECVSSAHHASRETDRAHVNQWRHLSAIVASSTGTDASALSESRENGMRSTRDTRARS